MKPKRFPFTFPAPFVIMMKYSTILQYLIAE